MPDSIDYGIPAEIVLKFSVFVIGQRKRRLILRCSLSVERKGSVENKKPRKILILRGFSDFFGLHRNNCWCPGEAPK